VHFRPLINQRSLKTRVGFLTVSWQQKLCTAISVVTTESSQDVKSQTVHQHLPICSVSVHQLVIFTLFIKPYESRIRPNTSKKNTLIPEVMNMKK
jgi:hypothetical protein